MSTNYDLAWTGFDYDALKTEGPKIGLNPIDTEHNDHNSQCYKHESSGACIWAFRISCNNSVSFCRYGLNVAAVEALEELASVIDAELVSEYDERWETGFESDIGEDVLSIEDLEEALGDLEDNDEFGEVELPVNKIVKEIDIR